MKMIYNKYFGSNELTKVMEYMKANMIQDGEFRVFYPNICSYSEFKNISRGSNQNPEEFLFEIVSKNKELLNYSVNDTCLMFFDILVRDKLVIKANIQVFVLDNCEVLEFSDESFYNNLTNKKNFKVHYYRLDYHPDTLGKIFSEPLPHVHTNVKKAPRFDMSHKEDDFIFDFMESIFINHYYNDWCEWIKSILSDSELDNFKNMDELYIQNNKAEKIVDMYSEILNDIKTKIQNEKKNYHIWYTNKDLRTKLSY